MWIATHERLLTTYRKKWGVGASPTCSSYDRDNETIIHVLQDFPIETQIWIRLVLTNEISKSFLLIVGIQSLRITTISCVVLILSCPNF